MDRPQNVPRGVFRIFVLMLDLTATRARSLGRSGGSASGTRTLDRGGWLAADASRRRVPDFVSWTASARSLRSALTGQVIRLVGPKVRVFRPSECNERSLASAGGLRLRLRLRLRGWTENLQSLATPAIGAQNASCSVWREANSPSREREKNDLFGFGRGSPSCRNPKQKYRTFSTRGVVPGRLLTPLFGRSWRSAPKSAGGTNKGRAPEKSRSLGPRLGKRRAFATACRTLTRNFRRAVSGVPCRQPLGRANAQRYRFSVAVQVAKQPEHTGVIRGATLFVVPRITPTSSRAALACQLTRPSGLPLFMWRILRDMGCGIAPFASTCSP